MHTIKIYDIDTTGFKGSGAREAAFLQVIEQFGITAMNTAMRCVMVPVMKTVFEVSDILEHDEQEVYEVTGKELGIGADEVRRRLEHIVDKMWINCDAEYFYEIYLFSQNIREPERGDIIGMLKYVSRIVWMQYYFLLKERCPSWEVRMRKREPAETVDDFTAK